MYLFIFDFQFMSVKSTSPWKFVHLLDSRSAKRAVPEGVDKEELLELEKKKKKSVRWQQGEAMEEC